MTPTDEKQLTVLADTLGLTDTTPSNKAYVDGMLLGAIAGATFAAIPIIIDHFGLYPSGATQ